MKHPPTLLTDHHPLILYPTPNKNPHQSPHQLNKTPLSLLPPYYHLYLSHNPHHFQSIPNFSPLQTNSPHFHQILT
ncbi:hypothetical protein [Bacillus pumilus]|uniref:hypothetical protein n=1 Tax=Bacillus pumilus TaxID=1408 RepID=UPI003703F053